MNRWMRQIVMAALVAAVASGCNSAKSPATVQRDVNSAERSASEKTAKADANAAKQIASANSSVQRAQRAEQQVAATQQENVDKTEAEGERQIALARCEALSGDREKACKDAATAVYESAVARAKQEQVDGGSR